VLDLLTSLVEKSLVGYEEELGVQAVGRSSMREGVSQRLNARPPERLVSEPRYRLLETVRQYAHDRLAEAGEAAVVGARHRDWYLALAERAEPELRRSEQLMWLDRLEAEHDNLRAALAWCRTEAAGADGARSEWTEVRLVGALVRFWIYRSHFSEGRQCLEGALSWESGSPARLRMRALYGLGWLTDSPFPDPAFAVQINQTVLNLARATGDPEGVALALAGLAVLATFRQDSEQAVTLAEESLLTARATGDPWLIGFCLHVLGLAARTGGDSQRATALCQESLILLRPVGDRWSMGFALLNLGHAAQERGEYECARGAFQEALVFSCELQDRRGIAWLLECLAEIAVALDRPRQGARLMGAAEALLDPLGGAWPPPFAISRERAQAALCAALGETAFAVARDAGRALPLEQAIAAALEEAPDG
jgi:non-specific serine/threonine protein kinase